MDTNTNGVISLDEFKAMQTKREEEMKQRRGDKYDATTAATKPSAEEVFKKLDADGDGTLTRQELAAGRMPRKPRPPRGAGDKKPEAPAAVTP
jgi:Ca2+-binding EF-hand superfamily protein